MPNGLSPKYYTEFAVTGVLSICHSENSIPLDGGMPEPRNLCKFLGSAVKNLRDEVESPFAVLRVITLS